MTDNTMTDNSVTDSTVTEKTVASSPLLSWPGAVPAGWPDAKVADLAKQAGDVAATLRATDAAQLLSHLSQSNAAPALVAAVCSKFPAIHGDADQDAQIACACDGTRRVRIVAGE